MSVPLRVVVALFAALSLLACTSMQVMKPTDQAAIRAGLKVGDEVSVSASNGKTYLLELIAVDDEKLIGVGDNKKVTIRYAQIEKIEVRRFSEGRTAGLAGGTLAALVVVSAVLVAIAFNGFAKALCLGFCEEDNDEE